MEHLEAGAGSLGRSSKRAAPMKREFEHRKDIVEIGRRLYEKSFIAASDGNISVRMERDRILTTPSGRNKGRLDTEDLVVTDLEGRKLYVIRHP